VSAAADVPVGWGILGCGWVARDHAAPAIRAARSARLAAVADPDRAARDAVAGAARRVASLAELLAEPGVEAVYVATPNHLHAEQAVAALSAGRHVLCEKPMATTAADARRIAPAARAAGRLYATAYDQRFHPAHERLATRVAEGRLGAVTQARIHYACWLPEGWAADNWRVDPARAGGGAAIDLAPHGIDLLAMLLGEEPVRAEAFLQRRVHGYPVDDGAALALAFPSGALATLHVAYNCPDALPRRRLELIGTRAMAIAEDTMGQAPGGRLTLIDAATGGASDEPFDPAGDPFARQIERVSRAVRGAPFPFTLGRDARLAALLLDALDRATLPTEAPHAA